MKSLRRSRLLIDETNKGAEPEKSKAPPFPFSILRRFAKRFDINIGQFLFARPMIMNEIKHVVHGYGVLMNFHCIEH